MNLRPRGAALIVTEPYVIICAISYVRMSRILTMRLRLIHTWNVTMSIILVDWIMPLRQDHEDTLPQDTVYYA